MNGKKMLGAPVLNFHLGGMWAAVLINGNSNWIVLCTCTTTYGKGVNEKNTYCL